MEGRSRGVISPILPVQDEIAAALAGFQIALLAQQGVGVLRRDHADPRLPGGFPLGGGLGSVGPGSGEDFLTELPVQLQVGRLMVIVHLVLCFSPVLDILLYPD